MIIISIVYTNILFLPDLQQKKYFCKGMGKKNQIKRFKMFACTTLSFLYITLSIYGPGMLCGLLCYDNLSISYLFAVSLW